MERMEPLDGNPSWIMILLLICLAAALSFVSFGFGLINLASAKQGTSQDRQLQAELDQKMAQLIQGQQTFERLRKANEDLAGEVETKKTALAKQAGEQQQQAQDLSALERRLQEVREQIAHEERTAQDLRRRISDKTSVSVGQIYGRTGSGKVPQWVECVKGGVVLQPQGERIGLDALKQKSSTFMQAIRHKGYVVFLVRPQGFEAFQEARQLAAGERVTLGYEPVDEEWVLNFGGGQS